MSRYRENTSYQIAHVFYRQREVLDALVWLGTGQKQARHLVRLVRMGDGIGVRMYLTNVCDPQVLSLGEVAQLYARRWDIEIVQPQMTKTKMLTGRGGGDHIADLHLLVGHDDAINQQLDQLSFLLKSGLNKSLLDSLAKGLNGLYHTCQFLVSSNADFQLACLFSKALLSLFQFVPASLVFFQRKDGRQIGVSQAFCLLSQADTRFAQILPASL